jgi:ABC-type transport system involved in multi-copper enzyme maturation permease subunit
MFFFDPVVLVYYVFVLGFFLGAPIVGFSYIRNDADQSGQPGWLWALATIFMSWIAVLAYLVVRALVGAQGSRPPR